MRAAIAGDVLSCSDDADVIGNSSDNCVAQPFRTLAAEALGAGNASVGWHAPLPWLLVRPACAQDVSTVVRLVAELAARGVWGNPRARACKGAESPLYVAGGGHSELGALTTNSVVLDMRPYFSAVEVHAAAREVGVGAGARLGEVATALRGTGLAAPVGVHPTVGVGLMLQGGLGRLARTHGLSVDAIAAAEVVTPDGNLRYLRAGSSGISMVRHDGAPKAV